MNVHTITTIVSAPALHDGQPVVAGTAIRVLDLVAGYLYRGHSPETLAGDYQLPLGDVLAALAYYYQNKAEMDAHLRADAERAEALRQTLVAQGRAISLE